MGSPAPSPCGGRPGFAGLSVLRTHAARGPSNPWLKAALKTGPWCTAGSLTRQNHTQRKLQPG
jgi:hypothetical protein